MKWAKKQKGFTIVELLIVVVVIAILAAITIVAYNGVQNRSKASAAQSATSQVYKKILTYTVDHADAYPAELSDISVANNGDTTYQYRVNNTLPRSFCLTAAFKNTSYYVSNTNTSPTAGSCDGHGRDGASPITNLALNPRATVISNIGGGRWAADRWGSDGTYSLITGISDHPAGITTAIRYNVNVARNSHGFHLASNPDLSSPHLGAGWNALLTIESTKTYTISAWVRKSGEARDFAIKVRCAVNNTTWSSLTNADARGDTVSSGSNQWTRALLTYTPATDCTRMAIAVFQNFGSSDTPGDTLDGTGLMITEGNTLYSFADGATPGWLWNGTVNSSTSTGSPL